MPTYIGLFGSVLATFGTAEKGYWGVPSGFVGSPFATTIVWGRFVVLGYHHNCVSPVDGSLWTW
jgi:hypothetical protein